MRRSFVMFLVLLAACGAPQDRADVPPTVAVPTTALSPGASSPLMALIDGDGQLGLVRADTVDDRWADWHTLAGMDGATAVATLVDPSDRTDVAWIDLSDGSTLAELSIDRAVTATATSVAGEFAAFVERVAPPPGDLIAAPRATTHLSIASLADGVVYETRLDGNFAAEAFGRRLAPSGLPAQVFLLEYLPADAPRFYRVRVLSTETGEVSLPVNLRDKSQLVDERMAGFTRSQVMSDASGLLFTLYRGTLDGTPDGEPYAFVHTLDLHDGVWCLNVDAALELDRLPGALAVSDDRLYVASANGKVGSFDIGAIVDPEREPIMEWVAQVDQGGGEGTPVLAADRSGAVVAWPLSEGLHRVLPDGAVGGFESGPPGSEAIVIAADGRPVAIGPWTFERGAPRPTWLGPIARALV